MKHKLRIPIVSIVLALTLALASGFSSCGVPKPVNPHPTPLDTPVEIANGIVTGTTAFARIVKTHHDAKMDDLRANAAKLSNSQKKAAMTAEVDKFEKINNARKQILKYAEDAAKVLQSADAGALDTAKGKIKLASDLLVNELLSNIDDPALRDSLTQLNNLMQRLIARQGN